MIRKTAIIGMGALGLLFGDIIMDAWKRDCVDYILDEDRLLKYREKSFSVNGKAQNFQMCSAEEAEPYDLVIVAVKWNSLPSALSAMRRCVGEDTIIISALNGISSEKIIGEKYGKNRVLCCIAQGMDAMYANGALCYTKAGELHLGVFDDVQRPLLEKVCEFFERSSMPYVAEEDILHRLWAKFMLNVGVNQTCAAFGTNYAGALAPGAARDAMCGAMRETIALANAEGIALSEKDLEIYIEILKTLHPEGLPSMAQDIVAHRKSEVEMFSGTVIKMSAVHGIKAPINEFLYNKIQEIEANF